MAELANALAEVFAAVLRAVGIVGTPRSRAAIREDLALLRELDEFPGGEFGPGTAPDIWLRNHLRGARNTLSSSDEGTRASGQ